MKKQNKTKKQNKKTPENWTAKILLTKNINWML